MMKFVSWFLAVVSLAIALAGVTANTACAEDYPTRPVRIIVGFGAGAAADTPARLLAQKFGDALGQQFVVENKPGAGSTLAAMYVAHAGSDGYTLLMATSAQTNYAAITIDPVYNVQKDFAPIVRVASVPNILVAHPSCGVNNLRELIALAKQKPNQIFYGSSGVGTTTHIAGELINIMAGIRLVDVPYPGSAQALTDVLAGRIQLLIAPASAVIQQINNGKLKALATTTARPAGIAPNVPTMAEAGLPGYDLDLWFGLLAPAGTPRSIVDKLARIADAALKQDDISDQLRRIGIDPVGGSPEDFAGYIDAEVKKATEVVNAANLRK
jgi:tripartite-type tricarboxylate transporter receptor subunit TctC